MNRRVVSGIVLSLLLIGMLAPVSNVQVVRAEPKTWTVDDEGPADFSLIQEAIVSPLVADGDTIFVCKGTYHENVVVNKALTLVGENREAIVDGGGTGTVVHVMADNVTITTLTIRNGSPMTSDAGIKLSDAKNCSISGNNITANSYGVILDHSSNNSISENNMANRHYGILLVRSSGNDIARNTVTSILMSGGMFGFDLDGSSSNNSIFANNITNYWYGFYLRGSYNNITRNNVTLNQEAFSLSGSGNSVSGNNITLNQYGFYIAGSDNTLRNNDMSNNLYNFGVYGYELADFINDVDTSNTVDGKPVYYWVNKHSLTVQSDAGYVALVNCTDITAENLDLQRNSQGVLLAYTDNMTITTNTIDGNDYGIYIWHSSGINITGNTLINNRGGVGLHASVNNSIVRNSMANNNQYSIEVSGSSNNSITENDVANSGSIRLYSSSHNSITGNNIIDGDGIFVEDSSNNSITGNNIANGGDGICFYHSSGNILRDNSMVGNRYNFGAVTYAFSLEDTRDFVNDVDDSNTIDDKPVYYWVNRHDETVPSDAGYVALINCTNTTVKNLDLKNNWEGILLAYTANTTITQNNMTANQNGIYLAHSSGNTFSGNRIANEPTGIHIYASSNNKFYHNFIANPIQVWLFDDSANVWDDGYPSGGNYWSNYMGIDEKRGPGQNVIGSDDIGDTPYIIDLYNQDYYPLMNPWIGRYVYVTQFNLHEANSSNSTLLETILISNSTIQNAVMSGDFSGFMNFTSLHGFKIETGSFKNQGCIRGNWTAAAEDMTFHGTWETFQFFDASRGAFTLKGAFSGDLEGIAEGSIVESVPGSGVYDRFHAVWRRNRVGSDLVSAIIELNGTITYQDSSAFPSTELYVYQATMNGSADGYYSGPLSAVMTHVRIEDEDSPCYGEGFSTISYDSQMGSGEGWTIEKSVSPGTTTSTGMFLNPLSGVVSATLHESETLTTLNGTISRLAVDVGLSLQPELKVRVWGPQRISPGETIEYIVEYGNYGLKTAENVDLTLKLPSSADYVSSTGGGLYNKRSHEIVWHLAEIPPRYIGFVSGKVTLEWGLAEGTLIEPIVSMPIEKTEIQIDPNIKVTNEILDFTEDYVIVVSHISNTSTIENFYLNISLSEILESFEPIYNVTKTLSGMNINWEFAVESNSFTHVDIETASDTELRIYEASENCQDAVKAKDKRLGFLDWLCNEKQYISQLTYQRQCAYAESTPTVNLIERILSWLAGKIPSIGKIAPFAFELANTMGKGILFGYDYTSVLREIQTSLPFLQDVAEGEISLDISMSELYELYLKDPKISHDVSTDTGTISTAVDPNIKHGAACYVLSGQSLNYTIEFENEGEGIAFGVYITDTLDKNLNASTLALGESGIYNPSTRTITWSIGEVGPHENGSVTFIVNVNNDVAIGTEIINFATVYFPSVPETTRTNGVVNVVAYAHDVATLHVTPSQYYVERGSSVLINVMVENQGVNTETFNVTTYANTTTIQTETVTLTSGNHKTVTFTWDTTSFPEGNYSITAVASVVPGETDTEDNTRLDGLVRLYEPPIPPPLLAVADFDPDTLNLKSQGQWITAYIELPEGHNPESIDAATILLNETIQPVLDPKYDFVTNSSEYIVDHDGDGILERMVKFNRTQIASWIHDDLGIEHGNVTLTIAGELYDGTPFEGSEVIRVFLR